MAFKPGLYRIVLKDGRVFERIITAADIRRIYQRLKTHDYEGSKIRSISLIEPTGGW